jgi:hypothetical protein
MVIDIGIKMLILVLLLNKLNLQVLEILFEEIQVLKLFLHKYLRSFLIENKNKWIVYI